MSGAELGSPIWGILGSCSLHGGHRDAEIEAESGTQGERRTKTQRERGKDRFVERSAKSAGPEIDTCSETETTTETDMRTHGGVTAGTQKENQKVLKR